MRRGCSLARRLAIAVTALAAIGLFAIVLSARDVPAREIRIVARNMTFYVDGSAEPNPAIRVRAGERVRLLFRNDDPGTKHDFVMPALGVETTLLRARTETSIVFRAPTQPSTSTYECTPHASMMRGTITVE
jgi:plastocyanin domain-containing protein